MGKKNRHNYKNFTLDWNDTTEEKKPESRRNDIKCDCNGVPLYVHAEREEQERASKDAMFKGIRDMVNKCANNKAMRQLEVVVVAVTDYITTEENQVIPAEVSLVRLTLGGGLKPAQYHDIINPPSEWPLGYTVKARNHAESTHKLCVERRRPDWVNDDRLHLVGKEIADFLMLDGQPHPCPVFTLDNKRDFTRTVFKDNFKIGKVEIWSLESLVREVYGVFYPSRLNMSTNTEVRDKIVNPSNSLEYHSALGCQFHREEEPGSVNHCSLNMAQRWAFMLLDVLDVGTALGVTLVAGKHWAGPNAFNRREIEPRAQNLERRVQGFTRGVRAADKEETAIIRQDNRSDTKAKSSRTDDSWRYYNETPEVGNTNEFPSLGGGRNPTKRNGRGGARGSARGACGGGPSTRPGEAGASTDDPSGELNGHEYSEGTDRRVSMKTVASSLLANCDESPVAERQPGLGARSTDRVEEPSTSQVVEQLTRVDLNGVGPSRAEESEQQTEASSANGSANGSVNGYRKRKGRNRKK